jgi:hypothetical protein
VSRQLKTPDVTKNQMIALATGIIALLAALGVPLSEANENRVFTIAVVLPSVLMISDAAIRVGRAVMAGKKADISNYLGFDPDDTQE